MREKYLDGLRGWAAIFVLLGHIGPNFLFATYPLPILPFFLDGQLAVYIFFVLSGYVLSIEFFRTGRKKAILDLALRRYPRLTIPIFASCLFAYTILKLGLFSNLAAADLAKSGWLKLFYTFEPSFIDFLNFSLWDVYASYSAERSYNAVLWTMPYEMAGSFIILGLLLLSSRNIYMQIGSIGAFICLSAWSNSPFLAFSLGMALASGCSRPWWENHKNHLLSDTTTWLMLFLSLGLAMFRLPSRDPIVLSFISAAILLSVLVNRPLQNGLAGRLSLWLGAISFPLYLTHLLVICSVSSFLYVYLIDPNRHAVQKLILIGAISIALCLLVAQLFRPIERLSVQVGRTFAHSAWGLMPLKMKSIIQ